MHGEKEAGSNPRAYLRPALLAELSHLDLTDRVSISNSRVVASGSFGDISKSRCILDDRKPITVAVKRLRFYLKEDIVLIFEKEIYVWSKLNHVNILSLLGFAFDESSGYPLLLSEWMANGSSLSFVKENKSCDLIHLVTGIAEGLAYLHENDIIHSDIKPDNVVVSDAGDARICDFGGSRIADASKSVAKPSTGIRGTQRYLSYELIALSERYTRHTKKSDVWAFGMTIFALITLDHPYAPLREAQVAKAIADRELPSFNFQTPRSSEEKAILRNICSLCWNYEPSHRIPMNFIRASLQDSKSHKNASRPIDADDSARGDVKRRRLSSEGNIDSDANALVNATGDSHLNDNYRLYEPFVLLSSKLDVLNEQINAASEVYQYMHAVKTMFSSLSSLVFSEEFQVDGKLDHLIRAMGDVFAFIAARSTTSSLQNEKQTIIRLLQQVIECCFFVNHYSRKNFEERKSITNDDRKLLDFVSFFVAFKEALDTRTGVFPTFVSSRVTHAIDESVLRQRLSPSDTDMKGQRLCLLGTRVEIQEQIIKWAISTSSQNILWLHGVAGSGKSTVIASVAEHFRGIYRLGAFLRFSRGASGSSSIISTIAFKLALFDSTIGSLILAETERDKDIVNAPLSTQFEKLLSDPLSAAAGAQQGPVVIILDALDECGPPMDWKAFMRLLLHRVSKFPSIFKFLITSRWEQDIDRAFESAQLDSITTLELDYKSHVSRRDVQLYLAHEIRNLVEDEDIPEDESIENQLSIIGETAAGLFVWASTFVKLISEHDSPHKKLAELASNARSLSGLDQLYSTVLGSSGISWHDNASKAHFSRVIGLVLLSRTPLTESTIDDILGPSVDKCRAILSRLRSVIDYRPGEAIQLFHTSFYDYLISCSHTEDWFIDIAVQGSFLATRYSYIMKAELR